MRLEAELVLRNMPETLLRVREALRGGQPAAPDAGGAEYLFADDA